MEKMLDILELSGFNSIPCLSLEDAKQCIKLTSFDLLVIGDAVLETEKKLIKNEMKHVLPTVDIFEHAGPIDNLVLNIKQTLAIS